MSNLVHPSGAVVHMAGERLNLTDMWRAAGSDPSRQPAEWLRSADARRFTSFLAETLNLGITQNEVPEGGDSHFGLVKTKRGGKNPGTEAHWQIGLAYAKYLSPSFHAWANGVVRERMEGKPVPASDELTRRIDGIARTTVHKVTAIEKVVTLMAHALEERDREIGELTDIVKGLVKCADSRFAAVDAIPALQVAVDAKVPVSGRRPIVRAISNSLARHCEAKGHVIRRDARGTKLYPLTAVHDWKRDGGDAEIRKLVAANTIIGPLFAICGGKV
ncbi:KilA-N domain-containing protein [Azospirillum himalayense]|uniref:KilA-N domain-containing protein n=1 Tax=Azospirillum himalayense TaxID=654847 RepID=A0ABW0FZ31_9PROT